MNRLVGIILLMFVGVSVSGCVIEEPGGWHHHPHYGYY
jgi:hypothetical protein